MHPLIKKLYEEYQKAHKAYLDAMLEFRTENGHYGTGGTPEKRKLQYLHNALQEAWEFEKANNRIKVEIGS